MSADLNRSISEKQHFPVKTFVIGANGFIGNFLFNYYKKYYPDIGGSSSNGAEPLKLLNLSNPDIRMLELNKNGYKDVVICAGITKIKACETEPDWTWKINVEGVLRIVEQLHNDNLKPIYLSSDYVFDGLEGNYTDDSPIAPVNNYGKQKAAVENAIPEICGDNYCVLRLSKVYSLNKGDGTLLDELASQIASGAEVRAASDQVFCPTLIDDLVMIINKLQISGAAGLFNVCAPFAISRYELAKELAGRMGDDCLSKVKKISVDNLNESFKRPHNTSMLCDRLKKQIDCSFTPFIQSIPTVVANWKNI